MKMNEKYIDRITKKQDMLKEKKKDVRKKQTFIPQTNYSRKKNKK